MYVDQYMNMNGKHFWSDNYTIFDPTDDGFERATGQRLANNVRRLYEFDPYYLSLIMNKAYD